jgi:hypothetical protein
MLRIVQPTSLNGSPRSQRRERWRSQLGSRSRGAVTSLGLRDVAAHRTTARRDRRPNCGPAGPIRVCNAPLLDRLWPKRAHSRDRRKAERAHTLDAANAAVRWALASIRSAVPHSMTSHAAQLHRGVSPTTRSQRARQTRHPPRWRAHTGANHPQPGHQMRVMLRHVGRHGRMPGPLTSFPRRTEGPADAARTALMYADVFCVLRKLSFDLYSVTCAHGSSTVRLA